MPVYTSSIEVTADYPTIKPSLNLNFARSRSLDPRITFTRASTATYIGRDGLVKYAGVDEARFDHDPDTLESLGLLIEESRTNVLANSGQISLTQSWAVPVPANQTVTPNAVVAPDGTTTGTQFTTNTPTGSNLQWIYQNVSGSYSNVTVTGSFWARADATKTLSAHITDGIAGSTYNYTVTTEWQRFSFTKTCGNGSTGSGLYPIFIANEPAGLNVYLWGGQLEVGAFATSYIPTSGSSVTRAVDYGQITGSSFTNFFNPTEGTYKTKVRINGYNPTGYPRPFMFTELGDIANDFWQLVVNNSGQNFFAETRVNGGTPSSNTSVSVAPNTDVIATSAVKNGEGMRSYYGNTLRTNAGASLSSTLDSLTFNQYNYNGTISELVYYPKALTDAQLQQLTS